MSKPYSEDLRERVVAAVEGGLPRRRAAEVFDVGVKLKAHLRKAEERTIPALYERIAKALQIFRADEFRKYFRKSGYAPA